MSTLSIILLLFAVLVLTALALFFFEKTRKHALKGLAIAVGASMVAAGGVVLDDGGINSNAQLLVNTYGCIPQNATHMYCEYQFSVNASAKEKQLNKSIDFFPSFEDWRGQVIVNPPFHYNWTAGHYEKRNITSLRATNDYNISEYANGSVKMHFALENVTQEQDVVVWHGQYLVPGVNIIKGYTYDFPIGYFTDWHVKIVGIPIKKLGLDATADFDTHNKGWAQWSTPYSALVTRACSNAASDATEDGEVFQPNTTGFCIGALNLSANTNPNKCYIRTSMLGTIVASSTNISNHMCYFSTCYNVTSTNKLWMTANSQDSSYTKCYGDANGYYPMVTAVGSFTGDTASGGYSEGTVWVRNIVGFTYSLWDNSGSGSPTGIYAVQNLSNLTFNHNASYGVQWNVTNSSPACVVVNLTSNDTTHPIDNRSGWINFTGSNVSATGYSSVKFTATDNCSNAVNNTIGINVTDTVPSNAWSVSLSSSVAQNFTEGPHATDPDGDAVTCTSNATLFPITTQGIMNFTKGGNASLVGVYSVNVTCTDSVLSSSAVASITLSPPLGITSSASVLEIGTLVNVTATGDGIICIDTPYAQNISCAASPVNVTLNITSFTTNVFSDGDIAKNLSYNGPSNKTVYVPANSEDSVVSLSVNLSGFQTNNTFPTNVRIYVNGTPAAIVGLVLNSTSLQLTAFNDSSSSKTLTFGSSAVQIAQYLRLPKHANVTGVRWSFSGIAGFTQTPSTSARVALGDYDKIYFNYTKPAGASNTTLWQVKSEARFANFSIPNTCWQSNAENLSLRIESLFAAAGSDHSNQLLNLTCYDGANWQTIYNVTNYGGAGFSYCTGGCIANTYAYAYDGDYNTQTFFYANWNGGSWMTNPGWGEYAIIYDHTMFWNTQPQNVWVELGAIDGAREWNYSGVFNTTSSSTNGTVALNSFLASCTADGDGYCYAPVYVYSDGGVINITSVTVNYTYAVNPVSIPAAVVQSFLSRSSGAVNISLSFGADSNGTLQVSGVQYVYVGGNKTLAILAHSTDYSNNKSANITLVASAWNYSLPRNVRYFEFIPPTPSSRGVQAYGQTALQPFMNVTNTGYGWQNFTFSLWQNETYSCVNLSVSTTPNASAAVRMTGGWVNITALPPAASAGLWFYADYACNNSAWRSWTPRLSARACAYNATCDEGR